MNDPSGQPGGVSAHSCGTLESTPLILTLHTGTGPFCVNLPTPDSLLRSPIPGCAYLFSLYR